MLDAATDEDWQTVADELTDDARNYVGAIERGEINPTLRVILKLSKGLQV